MDLLQQQTAAILVTLLRLLVGVVKCRGDTVDDDYVSVYGRERKIVQLPCPRPPSTRSEHVDVTRVEWYDVVYNSGRDSSLIYDSLNNTERRVNVDHVNRRNYEVNSEWTLTIYDLKYNSDPGKYFCRLWTDNDSVPINHTYYLTIAVPPVCIVSTGRRILNVGDVTRLSCHSNYSGNHQPTLRWSRDDIPVDSDDDSDIRLARHVIQLMASHDDDDRKYQCVMTFGDVTDYCSVRLHVKYAVRDVMIVGVDNSTSVKYVGDKLLCTARGHPSPTMTVTTDHASDDVINRRQLNGSREVELTPALSGSNMTLHCDAENTVDGMKYYANVSVTLIITDPPSMPRTTSRPPPRSGASKIDNNPVVVIVAVMIVALTLLAVIAAVVLVRKHRQQMIRKAAAAKAEAANRNHTQQNQSNAKKV